MKSLSDLIIWQLRTKLYDKRDEVITSKALRSPPWLGWPLWNICVTNDHGYVPLVVNTSRSFPHSWLITGFVTRSTRRVVLVGQELLILLEHLSSSPVFSGVRVTRSLALCVCFVDRCLSFCTFSFGHYVVCCSSIYGFWLPLWYLQTLLIAKGLNKIASICYCYIWLKFLIKCSIQIKVKSHNTNVYLNYVNKGVLLKCAREHRRAPGNRK